MIELHSQLLGVFIDHDLKYAHHAKHPRCAGSNNEGTSGAHSEWISRCQQLKAL